MPIGLHHVSLTTADMAKGAAFYDAVLGVLGYQRKHTLDYLCTWIGPDPEILLWIVEGEDRSPHRHGRPGWHHLAWQVDDRATVETVHQVVVDGNWTVVHPPKEYDYSDGYYAVFVEDPDGIRWEFAHIPTPTH